MIPMKTVLGQWKYEKMNTNKYRVGFEMLDEIKDITDRELRPMGESRAIIKFTFKDRTRLEVHYMTNKNYILIPEVALDIGLHYDTFDSMIKVVNLIGDKGGLTQA